MTMTRICLLLMLCLLSACTFRAPQLDQVRNLFIAPTDLLQEGRWTLHWQGVDYPALGLEYQGITTYLMQQRGELTFNGWNMVGAARWPGINGLLEIRPGEQSLGYYLDGRALATHPCQNWVDLTPDQPDRQYRQHCRFAGDSYTNQIDVNSQGVIVRMQFVLLPNQPPLVMSRSPH